MRCWTGPASEEGISLSPGEPQPFLRLAFSPCPNDTFIFHAWVHGLVSGAPPVREILLDIDALNSRALKGEVDVAKVSFHAVGHLRDRYALLHSGGALGRGCGPLLVVPRDSSLAGLGPADLPGALAGARVALPGPLTTAALVFRLLVPANHIKVMMTFDRIMPAVRAGEVEAGVIIHEGRLTYQDYDLACLLDLGSWWEEMTGELLPLGGIVIRRALGRDVAAIVDGTIRASLEHAIRLPTASQAYIRRHAQELDAEVCAGHIATYVNEFSLDYGEQGERALRRLMALAEGRGIVPASSCALFWDE